MMQFLHSVVAEVVWNGTAATHYDPTQPHEIWKGQGISHDFPKPSIYILFCHIGHNYTLHNTW